MSAESSIKKRKADSAKGLKVLTLYGVHPDDCSGIKQKSQKLKQERAAKQRKEAEK